MRHEIAGKFLSRCNKRILMAPPRLPLAEAYLNDSHQSFEAFDMTSSTMSLDEFEVLICGHASVLSPFFMSSVLFLD